MGRVVKTRIGGLSVMLKCRKLNLGVHKEIAGLVVVKARKRRLKRKDVRVEIYNEYFGVPPTPYPQVPVKIAETSNSTKHKRRTVSKIFATGIGVKIKGDQASPTLNPAKIFANAVKTVAVIKVGGETKTLKASLGKISI